MDGLMASVLTTNSPPTGTTRLGDWVKGNVPDLGRDTIPAAPELPAVVSGKGDVGCYPG